MPRKGENIFRRRDGRWEARYIRKYEDGKPKYGYVYGKSYAEAKERRKKAQAAPETFSPPGQRAGTFSALAAMFLADVRFSVRESTYTLYNKTIKNYLVPYLGGCLLTKLDCAAVNGLARWLLGNGGKKGTGLSPKTVTDALCVAKEIFAFGKQNGYACPNLDGIRYPQKKARTTEIFAEENRREMERSLLSAEDGVSLGVLLTLFTGLRLGELCGLRWEDVDFGRKVLSVRRTVERIADLSPDRGAKTKLVVSEPKTESSVRRIPLPAFLAEYLLSARREDGLYILSGREQPTEPHTFYIRYKRYLKRNGLGEHSFHALRHTFATLCMERGFDVKSLSEILGHASVTTTLKFYVHPNLEEKRRQMEALTPDCLSDRAENGEENGEEN
ncbi:MAG TPA: site-specific integrase [Candidatus Scatosoma pullicola]|nr:site-specific integrase [Candidatus Scatosoma pullicola]